MLALGVSWLEREKPGLNQKPLQCSLKEGGTSETLLWLPIDSLMMSKLLIEGMSARPMWPCHPHPVL